MLLKQPGVISGMIGRASMFWRRLTLKSNGIRWLPMATISRIERHLGEIAGPARSILTAERTALNFIQRLSGIATATREYVDAVAGTNARIVDTRKTTPGMRVLEKQAVRDGGGHNHRFGLFDGV